MGKSNKKENYSMETKSGRQTLSKTDSERDLGVLVDNDLKFTEHIETTVKKGK